MEKDGAVGRALERIYRRYDRRDCVDPDPLHFLYRYEGVRDREVAALIASSLAFGNVRQIMVSVGSVLDKMGGSPFAYVMDAASSRMARDMDGFRHRWASGEDLKSMFAGMRRVVRRYGSLEKCFMAGLSAEDEDVFGALGLFAAGLAEEKSCGVNCLLPLPERGSACKRLNLFLRWMVRRDAVDPGGWDLAPVSKLIVPLDVHMMRFGGLLGFTARKQADMAAAREITAEFRKLAPEDPVKYDFALTRLGIRRDADRSELLEKLGIHKESLRAAGGNRAKKERPRRGGAAT